jgi:hypothetical protein
MYESLYDSRQVLAKIREYFSHIEHLLSNAL